MTCADIIGIVIQATIAIATLLAARSALKSASSAEQSMNAQRKLTELQFQPALSINRLGHIWVEKDEDGYAVQIRIKNTSGGTANFKAVDAEGSNISRVDIGVPTIVGTDSETDIKIWVIRPGKKTRTCIALYYWDISNQICYRTIIVLALMHTPNGADVFEVLDQVITKIDNKSMPKAVLHWRKERRESKDYFDSDWLQYINKK